MAFFPVPKVLDAVGGGLGINLNPQKPYDDLARVIQDAAGQTRQFSDLQWQRQMEGLNRALGATQNYRNTYDKIYGTNSARPQQVDPMAMGLPPPPPSQGPGPVGPNQGRPDYFNKMFGSAFSQPNFAPVVRGTSTGAYTGPAPDGRAIDGQPRTGVTSRQIPGPAPGPSTDRQAGINWLERAATRR